MKEELRRRSASARRPLPSAPLQKAITDKRVAGSVDRSSKPPPVSALVPESEHTISPQLGVGVINFASDDICEVTQQLKDHEFVEHAAYYEVPTMSVSQSQFPRYMSFSATSAAVLAPSIPDDDVYTFDQLSPDQDAAHFQQSIVIAKSKPQSQPSDGWQGYTKPVDEDGLKITTESYVCDQLPSVKAKQTYDHPKDVSQRPLPLRKQRRNLLISSTADITISRDMSIDSLRWEVPPPLPPKRRLKSSFDDVPPPLPVKRSVTRTSKLIAKNKAPIRNAVSDTSNTICLAASYHSSDALELEYGDLGEDFYQEEESKELEYIPNETTVAQLFVMQEAKTFSWKLSDLSLVNLDDVKLLQLLEDAGAKSLGAVVCQLLYSLVATEIIIFYLKKFLKSTAVMPDNKIFDHNKFDKALEFCKLTNGRHRSLYKRLELGNSWEDAIAKLIVICHA